MAQGPQTAGLCCSSHLDELLELEIALRRLLALRHRCLVDLLVLAKPELAVRDLGVVPARVVSKQVDLECLELKIVDLQNRGLKAAF